MRFIDLSATIEPNKSDPLPVTIKHVSHKTGGDMLGASVNVNHKAFPDNMGLSLEYLRLSTHTGTHVDAPAHYGPLCEGKPSKTIDQIPLEWFYGSGVLLMCDTHARSTVSKSEIMQAADSIQYKIRPSDIVLIYTGASKNRHRPQYFTHFRGISPEATGWLLEQGVKIIGVDSFSFDPPFNRMLRDYMTTEDSKRLWPAHILGRAKEYCHIERLMNLEKIPVNHGFLVCCFPIKIKNCGAGWSRVVAIIPE